MQRYIHTFLLIFALAAAGCSTHHCAHWHPTPEGIDPSVFSVVIPQIEVRSNTVEEAVAILLQHWRQAAGTDKLPITVIVDYVYQGWDGKPVEIYEGIRPGYRQRFTFSAKDITVAECLDIIEKLSPHHLTICSGFLQIESVPWIEEDWVTAFIPVPANPDIILPVTPSGKILKFDAPSKLHIELDREGRSTALHVELDREGRVSIHNARMSLRSLSDVLTGRLKRSNGRTTCFLWADKRVESQQKKQVLALLLEGGCAPVYYVGIRYDHGKKEPEFVATPVLMGNE